MTTGRVGQDLLQIDRRLMKVIKNADGTATVIKYKSAKDRDGNDVDVECDYIKTSVAQLEAEIETLTFEISNLNTALAEKQTLLEEIKK